MTARPGSRATRRLVCVLASAVTLGACAGAMQTRPEDIPSLEAETAQNATPDALTRLGTAYYQAGRYADARATLDRAHQAGSRDGATSLYLGLANEELEDYTAARAAYERFLATGASGDMRDQIEARVALVARQELRQVAKLAIQREQQMADEPPTPQSIAVLPFRLVSLPEELQPLRTALAEMVVTDLGFTSLRSIERVRVQSLMDEIVLTQAGVTNDQTGARVGRMLRAENVVQGQIASPAANQITVDATVLDMKDRTPGSPFTRAGGIDAIFDLEKQLVYAILQNVGYTLTPAEREKIEENRSANLLAFLAYGRGLEAGDAGNYAEASAQFRQAMQLDPSFDAASVQAEDAAQLTAATEVSTAEVGQLAITAMAPPGQTLTQIIAQDVNPSPVSTVTNTPNEAGTQPQSTVNNDRPNPQGDQQTTPPVGQAAKARVIITVPNPTAGQPGGNRTGGN